MIDEDQKFQCRCGIWSDDPGLCGMCDGWDEFADDDYISTDGEGLS